jgi:hypothetical protein
METNHIPHFQVRFSLAGLFLFAFTLSLQAASLTWTGSVNSDWNTAGNWSPAQVPTSSDTVTIGSGTATATPASQFNMFYLSGGTLRRRQ